MPTFSYQPTKIPAMCDTSLGIRALFDAEAHLFASSVWALTDQLHKTIPSSAALPAPDHLLENPSLGALTPTQVIVLMDRVSSYLLDPNTEAPHANHLARRRARQRRISFLQIYRRPPGPA